MKMNTKKIASLALAAAMVAGVGANALAPGATPAEPNDTAGYMEELINDLDDMGVDEDGIPMVIAPNPMEEGVAADHYTLEVDGERTDIPASIMLPLRAVAERLGFSVIWQGKEAGILLDDGEMHAEIFLGDPMFQAVTSTEGLAGATGPLDMGAAPCFVNGVTYVPLGLFQVLLGNDAVTLAGDRIQINTGR